MMRYCGMVIEDFEIEYQQCEKNKANFFEEVQATVAY